MHSSSGHRQAHRADPNLDDIDDPTLTAFSKLAGVDIPENLSSSQKKKVMEDSLSWLRNNNPTLDGNLDDPTLEAVTKLAGVSLPPGVVTRKAKKAGVENAMDWLRSHEPDLVDLDDLSLESLANLTGVSLPKDVSSSSKKNFMDDALDWLRKNDISADQDLDDPTIELLSTLANPRA